MKNNQSLTIGTSALTNTRNPNKFCFLHNDHKHLLRDAMFLKKEIERLIAKGYLYQFFNKERQPEQKGKQVCTFYDELLKIR